MQPMKANWGVEVEFHLCFTSEGDD